MEVIRIFEHDDTIANMIALFRVELGTYKSLVKKLNIEAAKEELLEYINSNYPVYACKIEDTYAGYMVLRIDGGVVWVESIYVKEEYRRKGVCSALYKEAEKVAESYNEDTVYNYVHPNNHKMIEFLKKHGYTVLNLIEIRKPYKNEELKSKINVNNYEFNY